nr:hypothetical protein [Paenibacillus xylanexedens]
MEKLKDGFELKDRAMTRKMKKFLAHMNRIKYFESKKARVDRA